MDNNLTVSSLECEAIRQLTDFDLTMLLSEIHDHGWNYGRSLLRSIPTTAGMFDDQEQVDKEASRRTTEFVPNSFFSHHFPKCAICNTQLMCIGGASHPEAVLCQNCSDQRNGNRT